MCMETKFLLLHDQQFGESKIYTLVMRIENTLEARNWFETQSNSELNVCDKVAFAQVFSLYVGAL